MKISKIQFTKWGWKTIKTPHFSLIIADKYYQISFVVWHFHWWVIISKNQK